MVENLQLVNIHLGKIIKLGFVEKNYLWVENTTIRKLSSSRKQHDEVVPYSLYFIAYDLFRFKFRSARRLCRINVVCFCFAHFKNILPVSKIDLILLKV